MVFEKFRQGGDLGDQRPQGTGLGLPISRQIVEHFRRPAVAGTEPGHSRAPASASGCHGCPTST
jgi:signal transduction histidine kinase